jgi:Electron transfer DM13
MRVHIVIRLLSIPVVVAVVLAGLWLSGGAITNDFGVAMWLTAAWMALAGLLCLGVAVRSRALRWPVLGAYVVTAAVVGAYLSTSVFLDDEVNERVAVAAAPAPAPVQRGDRPQRPPEPRNVRLRAGRFESVRHPATGNATVIDLARGGRVLTLTDFEVDNGPDLRVYLVAGPARSEGDVDDYVDLGGLKGNKGNQQYEIPDDVDVGRYSTAVVWCRAFSVLFARAPTRR